MSSLYSNFTPVPYRSLAQLDILAFLRERYIEIGYEEDCGSLFAQCDDGPIVISEQFVSKFSSELPKGQADMERVYLKYFVEPYYGTIYPLTPLTPAVRHLFEQLAGVVEKYEQRFFDDDHDWFRSRSLRLVNDKVGPNVKGWSSIFWRCFFHLEHVGKRIYLDNDIPLMSFYGHPFINYDKERAAESYSHFQDSINSIIYYRETGILLDTDFLFNLANEMPSCWPTFCTFIDGFPFIDETCGSPIDKRRRLLMQPFYETEVRYFREYQKEKQKSAAEKRLLFRKQLLKEIGNQ